MAHGGSGGGGRQGGGIEQIAPPTGPATAFLGLGLFFAAVWFTIKHPRRAGHCVTVAAVVAVCLCLGGITDANPVQHPFIGLLVIFFGFSCAGAQADDTKGTRK